MERTPLNPTIKWTFAQPGLTKHQESNNETFPISGQNIKARGENNRSSMKIAGAEEVYMIGASLPVTALIKAMAISGLMWVAIGVQAAIWLN